LQNLRNVFDDHQHVLPTNINCNLKDRSSKLK